MLQKLCFFLFFWMIFSAGHTFEASASSSRDTLVFEQHYGLFFLTDSRSHTAPRILLDSGGATFLYSDAATFWGLNFLDSPAHSVGTFRGFFPNDVPWPGFEKEDAGIMVRDTDFRPPHHASPLLISGIFGHLWFARTVLHKNFRDGTIRLSSAVPDSLESVPLRKKTTTTTGFRSLEVCISGTMYHLLLKTGAFIHISEQYRDISPSGIIPAGYISQSVYDDWKAKGWLVLSNADVFYGSDVIRAENIRLGAKQIPFAWFSVRPDEVYQEFFSQWTDGLVVGALGPDVFQNAAIWLDFENNTLSWE